MKLGSRWCFKESFSSTFLSMRFQHVLMLIHRSSQGRTAGLRRPCVGWASACSVPGWMERSQSMTWRTWDPSTQWRPMEDQSGASAATAREHCSRSVSTLWITLFYSDANILPPSVVTFLEVDNKLTECFLIRLVVKTGQWKYLKYWKRGFSFKETSTGKRVRFKLTQRYFSSSTGSCINI